MCKFVNNTKHSRIDKCMKKLIEFINEHTNIFEVVACCCGHFKYPMTIILKSESCAFFDLMSGKIIPRTRNFYKKDEEGYYFIPETIQSNQRTCECGHKEWDEHKSSFYEYKGLKMVAQECNVKGCKCKKFIPKIIKSTRKKNK